MKALIILSLCAAVLLLAHTAQAYAIYNKMDYKVCMQDHAADFFMVCNFTIPPYGTHNGSHGSGLKNHMALWKGNGKCWITKFFDIPDGGAASVYEEEVKIFDRNWNEVGSRSMLPMDPSDCPSPFTQDY